MAGAGNAGKIQKKLKKDPGLSQNQKGKMNHCPKVLWTGEKNSVSNKTTKEGGKKIKGETGNHRPIAPSGSGHPIKARKDLKLPRLKNKETTKPPDVRKSIKERVPAKRISQGNRKGNLKKGGWGQGTFVKCQGSLGSGGGFFDFGIERKLKKKLNKGTATESVSWTLCMANGFMVKGAWKGGGWWTERGELI